jgi:hypothetical protein
VDCVSSLLSALQIKLERVLTREPEFHLAIS